MDQVREFASNIHPEVKTVSREEIMESLKENRLTLPYFTKYEYTALIGMRAQQLAEGAKPLASLEGIVTSSPRFVWDLTEREIHTKKLPYIIHRQFPNGKSEYWSATELNVIW